MSDIVIVKGDVSEDGKLNVELPPDAPRGEVEVVVRKVSSDEKLRLTPEDEAALEAEISVLLSDPKTFTGLGLTAEEIAKSPAIGIWKDREDMADPVAYLAEMRRRSRERRLKRED